ncbi:MAG: oligoendopeptidase F [Kurthia sp.]|nr:oligoendopeptidase F [Candidatus Kurthia equi]
MAQLPLRKDVKIEDTWNLADLVPNEETFTTQLDALVAEAKSFESEFIGSLTTAPIIIDALNTYEVLYEKLVILSTYANLSLQEDRGNGEAQMRYAKTGNHLSTVFSSITFLKSELLALPKEVLEEAKKLNEKHALFIKDLLRDKPYQLHPEVEKALATLSMTLDAPYDLYNTIKSVDMSFPNFEVNGESLPLSYSSFENEWELEVDVDKRRAAFKGFSEKLKDYQSTTAQVYNTHVQTEKKLATMRGYDSVFDSLLHNQYVERDLYNRQIDVITKELAPHMRRYATLLKEVHGLDKMTFADLKIALDPAFDPEVSKEEALDYVRQAVAPMGQDYLDMVEESFANRWIDYAPNQGKSTGAFCSSPYGSHPYILVSWSNKMTDVFTLIHELGHAGHFVNAHKKQSIFNSRPSLYFIEAPSTMNEMLLANHLLKSSEDLRFKRWVISNIISKTYYHNFVTHLLEAAYQREVYNLVDKGEAVNASILNDIKRKVLEEFWGDAVEITEGAELTWMRQPHYYMGLYPYTYSAGLTISTQVSQRILNGEEDVIEQWLEVLQAGGTKSPAELAQMAGVDVSTDEPLRQTVAHIGSLITQLEELTKEIG